MPTDGETLKLFIDNQPKAKIKIANELGISKQALFGYFKSKELEPDTKKKFEDYFKKSIFGHLPKVNIDPVVSLGAQGGHNLTEAILSITRPNEARQLYDHHILRERKLLFIPASVSKNKKDDYVPLSDYVLQNYQQKGRLFKAPVNYYGEKFKVIKDDLGLAEDYTLYSIKATRAIHLANDGADPYTIMQLFRHSGLDITMSYLRDLGININREATTKGIRF